MAMDPPPTPEQASDMPATLTTRRFNVDEYYRMAAAGILEHTERVELIEGEIVRMAAIGSRHASCVDRLSRLLNRALADRATVRTQNPVRLSDMSEPEPDVALVEPRADDYASAHPGPTDVALVVEVADATEAFDREVKGILYARAGIGEYWLVDLPKDRVEVRREPGEEGYRRMSVHEPGDRLRPSAFPNLEIAVGDVLPPRP